MEDTNPTAIPFIPAGRDEITQRAKSVSHWLGTSHMEGIRFLAILYGYNSVREMQMAADRAEGGIVKAGPYRDDYRDKDVPPHVEATIRRYLGLGQGVQLLRAAMLGRAGLYQPIAQHRHAMKSAEEWFEFSMTSLPKGWRAKLHAPVRRKAPPPSKVFHTFEIGGRHFYGVALHDLYLVDGFDNWAYLGPSMLYHLDKAVSDSKYQGPGWYICKYDPQQIAIPLVGFTKGEALALAEEFGIPATGSRPTSSYNSLYSAQSAEGLRAWITKHRIAARRMGQRANYLKDWHEMAS